MFEKFTQKSQEIIINAQVIAQENKKKYIEALHVLLALLAVDDSIIKPVFDKLGVDINFVRKQTVIQLDKLPKANVRTSASVEMVQGTNEVALIFERARKEGSKMGDEYISTEHILLSLVGIKSKAQAILLKSGIEYEKILEVLATVRGASNVNDPNPESKYAAIEKYTINLTDMARNKKL
ncbi:MAG: type VI secretion system ATPase TssH, partial [Candidatus Falkowbacteria bacterium]|nr:type VI secretion system ATPase TssH [Candidatus Falkowbacteria bacterium]